VKGPVQRSWDASRAWTRAIGPSSGGAIDRQGQQAAHGRASIGLIRVDRSVQLVEDTVVLDRGRPGKLLDGSDRVRKSLVGRNRHPQQPAPDLSVLFVDLSGPQMPQKMPKPRPPQLVALPTLALVLHDPPNVPGRRTKHRLAASSEHSSCCTVSQRPTGLEQHGTDEHLRKLPPGLIAQSG
jgi:hypothetical protein